jgi:hypothetical protein
MYPLFKNALRTTLCFTLATQNLYALPLPPGDMVSQSVKQAHTMDPLHDPQRREPAIFFDLQNITPSIGSIFDAGGESFSKAACLCDVNGDGNDDWVIGANTLANNGFRSGGIHVIFGNANGTWPSNYTLLTGTNGFTILGDAPQDQAGADVQCGDFNNDGFCDPSFSIPAKQQVGIFYGTNKTTSATFTVSQINEVNGHMIIGTKMGANYSGIRYFTYLDFNHDNITDLAIGAYNEQGGLGKVYVVNGRADKFSAPTLLSAFDNSQGTIIQGELPYTGISVSKGKINSDSKSDLIIGGTQNLIVYSGPHHNSTIIPSQLLPSEGFSINTPYPAMGGDFDGDGNSDLIFQGSSPTYPENGAAIALGKNGVYFPSFINTTDVSIIADSYIYKDTEPNPRTPLSGATHGDVNGDGIEDAVFAGNGDGGIFIVYGKPNLSSVIDLSNLPAKDGMTILVPGDPCLTYLDGTTGPKKLIISCNQGSKIYILNTQVFIPQAPTTSTNTTTGTTTGSSTSTTSSTSTATEATTTVTEASTTTTTPAATTTSTTTPASTAVSATTTAASTTPAASTTTKASTTPTQMPTTTRASTTSTTTHTTVPTTTTRTTATTRTSTTTASTTRTNATTGPLLPTGTSSAASSATTIIAAVTVVAGTAVVALGAWLTWRYCRANRNKVDAAVTAKAMEMYENPIHGQGESTTDEPNYLQPSDLARQTYDALNAAVQPTYEIIEHQLVYIDGTQGQTAVNAPNYDTLADPASHLYETATQAVKAVAQYVWDSTLYAIGTNPDSAAPSNSDVFGFEGDTSPSSDESRL